MSEVQTCPRRTGELGPWNHSNDLDVWQTNRWEKRGPEDTATFFPEGFNKPRTCSFCGCAHHDDVIALMEAGWELEVSDKKYKGYLNPPGYRAAMRALFESNYSEGASCISSPVPPVKFYSMHASKEQIERINELHQASFKKS